MDSVKKYKAFNVRLPIEKHRELKKISYMTDKSIANILRESVDRYLKDNKKYTAA